MSSNLDMIDWDNLHVRVKMCGTTRIEDAQFAVTCGVDALGFIFVEKSPRNISIESAKRIIESLPLFVDRVGVFVNAPLDRIKRCVEAGLSYVQLHGSESVTFCETLKKQLPYIKILKAFRVGPDTSSEDFTQYREVVDGYLLDTYVKGVSGGTGEVFDWSLIERLGLEKPYLLAGGISPDNVAQAIGTITPYGLDVNSGVESSPGVKDHSKLEKLMTIVRR